MDTQRSDDCTQPSPRKHPGYLSRAARTPNSGTSRGEMEPHSRPASPMSRNLMGHLARQISGIFACRRFASCLPPGLLRKPQEHFSQPGLTWVDAVLHKIEGGCAKGAVLVWPSRAV